MKLLWKCIEIITSIILWYEERKYFWTHSRRTVLGRPVIAFNPLSEKSCYSKLGPSPSSRMYRRSCKELFMAFRICFYHFISFCNFYHGNAHKLTFLIRGKKKFMKNVYIRPAPLLILSIYWIVASYCYHGTDSDAGVFYNTGFFEQNFKNLSWKSPKTRCSRTLIYSN